MPIKTLEKKKKMQETAHKAPPASPSRAALPKGKVPKAPPSKVAPKAPPSKVAPKPAPSKVAPKPAPSKVAPKPAAKVAPAPKAALKAPLKVAPKPALSKIVKGGPKPAARDPRVGVRPVPDAPKPLTLEERVIKLDGRLQKADSQFIQRYKENLDMSWIHHDSALEGVVYTLQELKAAIDPQAALEVDSSLQPICEEIRRHREALEFVRDYAAKPKQQLTVDTIKQIYLILHPEEGDLKTVKYRKEVPQHRLYFHEYCAPDKVAQKVRAVVDWVNDPETRKARSPMRIAGRAHYDLVRAFPFPTDSGKVARLFMNLMLLRAGLPPAVVHSTERQRYYDALKGSSAAMNQIVAESVENNLASIEKLLDSYEAQQSALR